MTYTGSVTKDGKTLYYADLQDALDHASGGTFHFLTPSLNTRLIVPDNVTIDFTNMSLYHDTSDSELVLVAESRSSTVELHMRSSRIFLSSSSPAVH